MLIDAIGMVAIGNALLDPSAPRGFIEAYIGNPAYESGSSSPGQAPPP